MALLIAALCSSCLGDTGAPDESQQSEDQDRAVRSALAHLDDRELLPEVAWWEVDGNDVYIGVRLPADLQSIVNPAALHCQQALDRGCHAWAVDASASSRGWRPGDPGALCEATARYGRVEDSSCQ